MRSGNCCENGKIVNGEPQTEDRMILGAVESLEKGSAARAAERPGARPAAGGEESHDESATLARLYAEVLGLLPYELEPVAPSPGVKGRLMTLIHGDETTAREVLTAHIRSHEGIAYVVESRTRTVPLESGKIDPNRMFSRVGAEANLKLLNPDWPPERIQAALAVLDRGR